MFWDVPANLDIKSDVWLETNAKREDGCSLSGAGSGWYQRKVADILIRTLFVFAVLRWIGLGWVGLG